MNFQALPGFRDFYPADCAARNYIFKIWSKVSEQFGFTAYDGPPLEPLELFTTKSGSEIVGQLYNFKDKGDREITLRPEMTPTLARMAGLRHKEFKKPMKWYCMPQMFRYERAQKGRLREHYQYNADIIGEEGLGAEAELLALLVALFKEMGLSSEDIVIRVSDRFFWTDYLAKRNVPESQTYDFFQALDKMERADQAETRKKLGPLADEVYGFFEKGAMSERLEQLMGMLDAYGIAPYVEVDLKIVRGLAYYTGVVFEANDRKKEFRAIAGGGRYNNLLKLLSGADLPAIGYAMGDVVIAELLKSKGLMPAYKPQLDYFVVIGEEAYRAQGLKIVGQLRGKGYKVDYPIAPMKFNKQLELASDRGAAQAIIVDAKFNDGRVGLKNLETREQKDVALQDLKLD
jgi:histidyl-tRNA synthetase